MEARKGKPELRIFHLEVGFPASLYSAGHCPRRWPVGVRGRAQQARRDRDDGHGRAGHVEDFDTVAVFHSRHDMAFHNRAHVACLQILFGQVLDQYDIGEKLKRYGSPRNDEFLHGQVVP